MNARIEELNSLITRALDQRKNAYRLNAALMVRSINHDLRNWKHELASLKVGA